MKQDDPWDKLAKSIDNLESLLRSLNVVVAKAHAEMSGGVIPPTSLLAHRLFLAPPPPKHEAEEGEERDRADASSRTGDADGSWRAVRAVSRSGANADQVDLAFEVPPG